MVSRQHADAKSQLQNKMINPSKFIESCLFFVSRACLRVALLNLPLFAVLVKTEHACQFLKIQETHSWALSWSGRIYVHRWESNPGFWRFCLRFKFSRDCIQLPDASHFRPSTFLFYREIILTVDQTQK